MLSLAALAAVLCSFGPPQRGLVDADPEEWIVGSGSREMHVFSRGQSLRFRIRAGAHRCQGEFAAAGHLQAGGVFANGDYVAAGTMVLRKRSRWRLARGFGVTGSVFRVAPDWRLAALQVESGACIGAAPDGDGLHLMVGPAEGEIAAVDDEGLPPTRLVGLDEELKVTRVRVVPGSYQGDLWRAALRAGTLPPPDGFARLPTRPGVPAWLVPAGDGYLVGLPPESWKHPSWAGYARRVESYSTEGRLQWSLSRPGVTFIGAHAHSKGMEFVEADADGWRRVERSPSGVYRRSRPWRHGALRVTATADSAWVQTGHGVEALWSRPGPGAAP